MRKIVTLEILGVSGMVTTETILKNVNTGLQTAILLVSFLTVCVGFYRAFKYRNHDNN